MIHIYWLPQANGKKTTVATDARTKWMDTRTVIQEFTNQCFMPNNGSMQSPIKQQIVIHRPRIYIYNIQATFNMDIVKCLQNKDPGHDCYTTDLCGFGPQQPDVLTGLDSSSLDLMVHRTWQFSLELIIHQKLLASPHRVLQPNDADVFYVPYYAGMDCFCHPGNGSAVQENIRQLEEFLSKQEPYSLGKPHLMTLSKIEREHMTANCPLLRHQKFERLLFIGIEEETNVRYRQYKHRDWQHLIVAPYPSYGHLNSLHGYTSYVNNIHRHQRTIIMLLAASARRSNHFRAAILDQFLPDDITTSSYHMYLESRNITRDFDIGQIWLQTPECHGDHHRHTLTWMYHSHFCLQPPGDSPTRKSYYDAIISGCIPVVFSKTGDPRLPFDDRYPHREFTVTLDSGSVTKNRKGTILEQLRNIPRSRVIQLQENLHKVAPLLQYDFPILEQGQHNDAISMIISEINQRISQP